MVKESWGAKRTCPKCETRFYDLNKDPLICPNCGNTFSLESLTEVFKKSPKEDAPKKGGCKEWPVPSAIGTWDAMLASCAAHL